MKCVMAWLVAVAVVAALGAGLGGCADPKYEQVRSEADFQPRVLESEKPVVVDFYKGGCPTCGLVQPLLDRLREEYQGRVDFAQFMIMRPDFEVTDQKIKDKYDIVLYPTVILFVNGHERNRWSLEYDIEKYRKGIEAALGGSTESKK